MAEAARTELMNLCNRVKENLSRNEYKECAEDICYAMYLHSDAPEPHNLLGIVMEKQRNHIEAMKYFRTALDLTPTYLPALENLMDYAGFDIRFARCRFCSEISCKKSPWKGGCHRGNKNTEP